MLASSSVASSGTFRLHPDPGPATASPPCLPSAPGILIIDDEPLVCSMLEIVCRLRGFHVWTANSGAAGIDCYRRHREHIQLVLLDVRMPDLDGPHTLAELRQVNPTVTCCFMSGESGEYTVEDLLALGAVRFFAKPFAVMELADQLWLLTQAELRRTA